MSSFVHDYNNQQTVSLIHRGTQVTLKVQYILEKYVHIFRKNNLQIKLHTTYKLQSHSDYQST